MSSLIQNEFYKLWFRRSTLVFILLTMLFGLGFPYICSSFEIVADGAYYFYNLGGITSIINLFIVIISSTIVASEFSQGTIKFLLIRPFSRSQILLSKIITAFIMALLLTSLLFITSYLGTLLFFKDANLTAPLTSVVDVSALNLAFRTAGANLLLMLFYIMISVFISASFRSQALAVGIGTAVLFSSSILNGISMMMIQKYSWLRWNPFNTLNIKDSVMPAKLAESNLFDFHLSTPQMLIALTVYILLFYYLSQLIFKRRDVSLS